MANIGIVYYSMYGTAFEFAKVLAEGVEQAGGKATLLKVPHNLPQAVADSPGVKEAIEAQSVVGDATVDALRDFDGIIFGAGTRFGLPASQLQSFLDTTGGLWAEGALVGKAAGFFTGASTIHGGHETTIMAASHYAMHQGMVVVPAGYAIAGNSTTRTGGSPYGPGYFAPQGDESKQGLDETELQIARDYAAHFNTIAGKLAA